MSKPVILNFCSLNKSARGRPTYPSPMMPIFAVRASILLLSRSALFEATDNVEVFMAIRSYAFMLPCWRNFEEAGLEQSYKEAGWTERVLAVRSVASGAKALILIGLTAWLKPCPFQKRFYETSLPEAGLAIGCRYKKQPRRCEIFFTSRHSCFPTRIKPNRRTSFPELITALQFLSA